VVNKIKDGRPHIADMIKAGEIQLVFTTVDETRTAIADSRYIRTAAIANRVTYYTTMAGCEAATEALKHQADFGVASLQELHAQLPRYNLQLSTAAGAWPRRRRCFRDLPTHCHGHRSPHRARRGKAQGRAAAPEVRRTPCRDPGHCRSARAG
jgi:hypothetical protein